jgi:hypothetical protein
MMGSAREECRVVQEMWFVRGLRNGPPVELVAGTAGAPVPSGLVSSCLVMSVSFGGKVGTAGWGSGLAWEAQAQVWRATGRSVKTGADGR